MCASVPNTWNRVHDYGAEWTGPLLSDDNDTTTPAPIAFPWLERRKSGYWFDMEEEEVPLQQSEFENISEYTGRTITDSVRGKAKYSLLPKVGGNSGYQRL